MFDNNLKLNCKKEWNKDNLLHNFMPVFDAIFQHPRSEGFKDEVDPEALGIPEYRDIIKNPIALCTVLEKLTNGLYKDPWNIVNDFWLMFNNCLLFNKKSTPIYKDCLQLIDVFIEHSTIVMKKLGFCCSHNYFYEPKLKSCSTSKSCLIKTNSIYYKANTLDQEISICEKCYNGAGEVIEISEINKISKEIFLQMKNDVKEHESFVECTGCGREWHTVCALYRNDGNQFFCPECETGKEFSKKYTAEMIPISKLSEFIENQVNEALKKENSDIDNVIIRDFISTNNKLEYQPKFKEQYVSDNETVQYTSRAIYAFTKIDGVDVMFFGINAQEYSPNIKGPNRGCVNITYLDSVSFFEPSKYKTFLYHQILLSYLDFVRRIGITYAHLWVCPSEIGNDYIFHRHPIDQKLPKKDRLKSWYESAFLKGKDSIVIGYESIIEYYRHIPLIQPNHVAYFDGDFWPTEIETLLNELDKEITNQLNESNKSDLLDGSFEKSRKRKKRIKNGLANKKRKIDFEKIDEEINIRFLELLKKFGDDFIVVKLISMKQEEMLDNPNEIWTCEVTETRDRFLPFCKDFNLEFSTLRRVKYSTMQIINEIFRENKKCDLFCNICNVKNMYIRYYCRRCIDYDLCDNCYRKHSHEHEMVKVEPKVEILLPEQYSELISHAFNCNDANCSLSRCDRVKSMKQHLDNCNIGNCNSCIDMVASLVNHSRFCKTENCTVYRCENNRILKEKQINQIQKNTLNTPETKGNLLPQNSTPKQDELYFYKKMQILGKITELKNDKTLRTKEEIDLQFRNFMKKNPQLHKVYEILKTEGMERANNNKLKNYNHKISEPILLHQNIQQHPNDTYLKSESNEIMFVNDSNNKNILLKTPIINKANLKFKSIIDQSSSSSNNFTTSDNSYRHFNIKYSNDIAINHTPIIQKSSQQINQSQSTLYNFKPKFQSLSLNENISPNQIPVFNQLPNQNKKFTTIKNVTISENIQNSNQIPVIKLPNQNPKSKVVIMIKSVKNNSQNVVPTIHCNSNYSVHKPNLSIKNESIEKHSNLYSQNNNSKIVHINPLKTTHSNIQLKMVPP